MSLIDRITWASAPGKPPERRPCMFWDPPAEGMINSAGADFSTAGEADPSAPPPTNFEAMMAMNAVPSTEPMSLSFPLFLWHTEGARLPSLTGALRTGRATEGLRAAWLTEGFGVGRAGDGFGMAWPTGSLAGAGFASGLGVGWATDGLGVVWIGDGLGVACPAEGLGTAWLAGALRTVWSAGGLDGIRPAAVLGTARVTEILGTARPTEGLGMTWLMEGVSTVLLFAPRGAGLPFDTFRLMVQTSTCGQPGTFVRTSCRMGRPSQVETLEWERRPYPIGPISRDRAHRPDIGLSPPGPRDATMAGRSGRGGALAADFAAGAPGS